MDIKQLREMVEEAVSAFLDEFNYNDRMAALKASRPAGSGQDQISIDKLITVLDGLEKSGKTNLSMAELQDALKGATAVAAPLGKAAPGAGKDIAALAHRASTFSGPGYVRASIGRLQQREGKVRMTEADLKEMVSRVVAAKLAENGAGGIGMGNPIMAKREIIALMDQTSRSFEQEIIKTFKLQNPDVLSPELQRSYLEIVEGMKAKMVQAAMEAVQSLVKFPKIDEGNGGMK